MKKFRSTILTILLIVVLLVGVALIFINPIQTYLISNMGERLRLEQYTVEDFKINDEIESNFEFEAVQSLSIIDVLQAQSNIDDLPVIGNIVIPSVDLQLPILKGVSNEVLAVGAGTMKPEQRLGTGNYALAGHYFEEKDILFSPLYYVENGDKVYLTDLENIYEYSITEIKVIEATDVYIIDDIPSETILTMITCAEAGTKRLAVRADFVNSYSYDDAPSILSSAF